MAQSFVTDAGTLIIPGAYPQVTVQTANGGLATTGVIMLVGEADAGPDWTLESDLGSNFFGPDQISDVVAKYKSGNLVDAFRAVAAPANDPAIAGAPSQIVIVKTNASLKATANLLNYDSSTYSAISDKSWGKSGNLISYTVSASPAEVVPTATFTWIPAVGTLNFKLRVNGQDTALTANFLAEALPSTAQTTFDGLSGVGCSGGAARGLITGGKTVKIDVVSGAVCTFTVTTSWVNNPSIGDTLWIPSTSALKGVGTENSGGWIVTAVTNTVVTATKLRNGAGAVGDALVMPSSVVNTPSVAADIECYEPLVLSVDAADPSPGIGKTLEVADAGTGTDKAIKTLYTTDGVAVPWLSTNVAPSGLLTSSAEYGAQIDVSRASDGASETLSAAGEVALAIGYVGTTATLTITDTTLSTTVTGGSGASLSLTLADFPTVGDLATYINTQTGYTCSATSGPLAGLSPVNLDNVSGMHICSTWGSKNGRVKADAYKLFKAFAGSGLVQLGSGATPEQPSSGLPGPQSLTYLAGGSVGATTSAGVVAAIDALEKVRGNFLVPLFSRSAADDIADGLTDAGSTYDIDALNAYCKSHCLKMSTLKRRKNRQAFLSFRGAFADAKTAAGDISSFRCAMTFEDYKNVSSTGTIKQYQPWMGAVLAAGMQAAGFYRAIFNKGINCSGVLQAAGDWDDQNDTQVEDALTHGLLPARRAASGGFRFASDQTTYSKDTNFVYNSIQAIYAADIIALATAQRMEDAFVGQSLADVSKAVALSYFESIMADFLRLKLIAASDDAPRGFRNAVIQISGPAMKVSVEIKLAGAIYFIPISFYVSQVVSST